MLLLSVGISAQSIEGSWKGKKDVDISNGKIATMHTYKADGTSATVLTMTLSEQDMTITFDIRIPGTYTKQGDQLVQNYNKKASTLEMRELKGKETDQMDKAQKDIVMKEVAKKMDVFRTQLTKSLPEKSTRTIKTLTATDMVTISSKGKEQHFVRVK